MQLGPNDLVASMSLSDLRLEGVHIYMVQGQEYYSRL